MTAATAECVPGPGAKHWRGDIQILRGYAVCAVILFHAGFDTGFEIAPSGYLGVDIFFVVSGYLIGGIVLRDQAAQRFAFGAFYRRRVRRLAPAAFVTLAATIAAAAMLLTASAYERFWPQLLGALSFSTNIVLWRQINYFNDGAQGEPLLHVWSLAVEEQFYLVFPVLLLSCPRRWWMPAIGMATAASLAAYLTLYAQSPGAAFYLLPTRAWEIGLGVAAAGLNLPRAATTVLARLRPLSAFVVGVMPFVPSSAQAYWLALPACLATAVIVAAPPPSMVANHWRPAMAIGDRSYALYLVHWPLFAFANTVHLGAPLSVMTSLGLIALTVISGEILFRCVETPLRRERGRPVFTWIAFLATSLLLAAIGAGVLQAKRDAGTGPDVAGVLGLELPGCDADTAAFDGRCAQSSSPQILVWGDSFSQHLVPAIVATAGLPIAQASEGGCPPIVGFAPIDLDAPLAIARRCVAFNASVLTYIARMPSIEVVVLSGRYLRYGLPGTRALHVSADSVEAIATPDPTALAMAQQRTSAAIRAMGKRVVIVAGPAQASFDVGQCWERTNAHLPLITSTKRCAISAASMHSQAAWADRLLARFAATGTPVINLAAALCRKGVCATELDGTPLYRDAGHFSRTGSVLIGRRKRLGQRIWQVAR